MLASATKVFGSGLGSRKAVSGCERNGDVTTTTQLCGNRTCRVEERGKECTHGIRDGTNQGNREQDETPDVRWTQSTSRAKTRESTQNGAPPGDCQIAKCEPHCWQNPCPLCRRISPSSPHAEPDNSCTDDAEEEFLPDHCSDRVRRNCSPQGCIQNRRSDYGDNEVN